MTAYLLGPVPTGVIHLHKTRSMRLIVRPVGSPASAAVLAAQGKAAEAAAKAKSLIASGVDLATALLLTDVSGEVAAALAAQTAAMDQAIVIENLEGNNGLEMQFQVRRGIDMSTSTASVKIFNLPESDLKRIAGEAREIGRIEDVDLGGPVWSIGQLDDVGSEATTPEALGYATVELQAGYDGNLSTIFAGTLMDCSTTDELGQTRDSNGRFTSSRYVGVTSETTLTASSGISQVALSSAAQTFEAGTSTFAILDALRRTLKLGPGNCTPDTWLRYIVEAALHTNKLGQAIFSATSLLTAPYIITDAADEQLEQFLKYSGVKYFIDQGELWLVPRIGFIEGTPAKLEPMKERPRTTTSGQLECKSFLSPGVRPGYLVTLDADDVDPVLSGTYRCDNLQHDISSSANEEATTIVQLSQRQPLLAAP